MDEHDLFTQAIQLNDPPARLELLRQACAGNESLLKRVEELLEAHARAGGFLESPPAGVSSTPGDPLTERPGTQIGPYKLLEQIGEGGFGVVFMAEQTQPVQRKVALKVIKPGMDSRQVIARFEAERQALAMMDHVNIARVLDAGATQEGRPYFVMELVHGVPITQYCDENRLTPRQRLELFVPVCQAIQHAHQKGIIHRDIKPSNVMVTLYDGQPVPKVIDFGVAKATEQKLTQRTLFTQYGTLIGTLEYMSPEQAEMSALGVDTRSDIYSLGVLLYELLTGSTPLGNQRIKETAYAEILRMIREEDPPRPSTRLSESGEALRSISAQRQIEPARLSKLMRGELDWIVMKTLEKDRNRRYETASGFAADVQRYLNDEPVQACPPSAAYRFHKFARRNRTLLTTASVISLALLMGSGISIWQATEANRARSIADERLVLANDRLRNEQQARREAEVERQRADANFQKAIEAVDRMLFRVGDDSLRNVPQMEQVQQEIFQDAVDFYEGFLSVRPDDRRLRFETAKAYLQLAGYEEHRDPNKLLQSGHDLLRGLHAESPDDEIIRLELAHSYDRLGWRSADRLATSEDSHRHAIQLLLPLSDSYPANLARSYRSLALDLRKQRRFDEAEQAFRQALELNPGDGHAYRGLALLLEQVERVPEAIEALHHAIDRSQNAIGDSHKWKTNGQDNLATFCDALGDMLMRVRRTEEALPHLVKAVETWERLALDFPSRARFRDRLAASQLSLFGVYRSLKRDDDARQIIDRLTPHTADEYFLRGKMLQQMQDYELALRDFDEAIARDPTTWSWYKYRATTHFHLGHFDQALANLTQAHELKPELNPNDLSTLTSITPSRVAACSDEQFQQGILALAGRTIEESTGDAKATAYEIRGELHQALGQLIPAVADFSQSLALAPNNSKLSNNLAWIRATSADPTLRDSREAVELATKSIQLQPDGANSNTLAVALYRVGDWKAAIGMLEKSMELRKGGDSFDWFFLAMAHWQLGDKEQANQWYGQAFEWMEQNQPEDDELRRFRMEAAELLGVNQEANPDERETTSEP